MTQSKQKPSNKTIIGLTGGIASGKSLAAAFFKEAGHYIIDCDELSHEVIMKGNPAYSEVLEAIPEAAECLDKSGELDRRRLGAIVFLSPQKLEVLTKIIHRAVGLEIERLIKTVINQAIIIDAPLLLQSALKSRCDEIIVIYAPRETRIARIMSRNNLTRLEAEARVNAQMDWDKETSHPSSNYKLITNDGSTNDFLQKLKSFNLNPTK